MIESLITVSESLPYLLGGCVVTIGIVLCSLCLGFAIGVPLAVGHVYGAWPLRMAIGFFVWFFRGTPILVLLYLFYHGLTKALGLDITAYTASCLVLGLASAAYQSQIFRGSLLSLPKGQLQAARALGMTDLQGITTITLPQALRLSIPGWSNEFSILLKDSALVYLIGGAYDLMARTRFAASRDYEHIAFYATAGLLYYLITLAGLRALRRLERKTHIPGYAAGGSL